MMSLASIKQQNREVAARAAQEGMEPFVYFDVDEVGEPIEGSLFPFPFIGDYRPEGWTLVDEHFADASGFGGDNEPALSVPQLVDLIKDRLRESDVTVGWAIIEAGQFQVYVGEFRRSAQ